MMLVDKTTVLKYIPQRPPMVMVDGLSSHDETAATSYFRILAENLFCLDGHLQETGLIEHMAQTAALKSGYEAHKKGEAVKVGFIGAVKKLVIHQLPAVGQEIETSLEATYTAGHVAIVKVKTRMEDQLVAEAELSIFTQD